MSDEQQPIWKQAIKDASHPLHQATWLLFSEKMNSKGAAKLLAGQKEQVIDYLFQVLDAEELRLASAFGAGFAPSNAVNLLGEWKVIEAAPRLLNIIREDDWESLLHDRCILALEEMGEPIIDQIIAFGDEFRDKRMEVTAASILSHVGKGNARVFEWMTEVFKRQDDDFDTPFMAENLLSTDTQAAISFLEAYLQKTKVPKATAQRIQSYLKTAREGKWGIL